MMFKFGNSNYSERIDIIEKYNELFGSKTIDYLIVDIEFIVKKWLKHFNINNVAYYLSASVIKSKTGNPKFKFLISFNNPSKSKECYKKR